MKGITKFLLGIYVILSAWAILENAEAISNIKRGFNAWAFQVGAYMDNNFSYLLYLINQLNQ